MSLTRAGGALGIPGLYVTGDPGAADDDAKDGTLKVRLGLGWAKSHGRMGGMPIPDFIVELRRHVGHALLWLPAVTAVVVRGQHVLLVKRCDNGWTPVTGIVEPGENPADCAVREVLEESGDHAVARRLAWVHVTSPVVDVNGDHAQYLDHVFRMDWVDGEPFPADDESVEAGWFDLAALPPVSADMRRRMALACDEDGTAAAVFDTSESGSD